MDKGQVAVRFQVRGKVQGVFFRASAAREARRLGLCGHAVNLPDGSVEVLAVGRAGDVAGLERWLRQGPPAARVEAVTARAEVPPPAGALVDFRTG